MYPYFLKCAVQSESRFCRFLLHCGFLRRRVGLAVASPSSAALVRSVCTARDRRALRTRRPVHNLGPKSPITGWLSLCFLILCTRVQMTSHAGSARSQRPRPPGPRLRRLSAHRTTSARARLHKPSDLAPSALGRSPFVVGPRAVFADPLAPTGTLLVASMAVVNYHLDLAPLGVRHALSNPRIHVSRACVSVPPPTLQWPIRRPPAHIACAAASLTVFLHLLYLWQVCRRRERCRRGRWRAPQSPAEPSALAAERHSRGRARATRSSGSPAGR